jgi:hypothetical protein
MYVSLRDAFTRSRLSLLARAVDIRERSEPLIFTNEVLSLQPRGELYVFRSTLFTDWKSDERLQHRKG